MHTSHDMHPMVFTVIPVYNRIHFTLQCIESLKSQTYPSLQIIVADGGSTDDTVETVRSLHPDVIVLASTEELWWTGSMAMGIEYVLQNSSHEHDHVLMMNNDTLIPETYVETLVQASALHQSAVGSLIVDSRDPTIILDAGEYVVWESYSFPVKNQISDGETFCSDVDVLPGRGSIVPVYMIRAAGNVDARLLPHYLADYEFFYRLKRYGFRLGVCYETRLLAHIEETGIQMGSAIGSFTQVWAELFSRRSMCNVIDHMRFAGRHAPPALKNSIRLRLMRSAWNELLNRTPLHFFWAPTIRLIRWPWRTVRGQARMFVLFFRAINSGGIDVLCHPHDFPGLVRWPLYLIASPAPINLEMCMKNDTTPELLLAEGVIKEVASGWYEFTTLTCPHSTLLHDFKRLVWAAFNPVTKVVNAWHLRQMTRI